MMCFRVEHGTRATRKNLFEGDPLGHGVLCTLRSWTGVYASMHSFRRHSSNSNKWAPAIPAKTSPACWGGVRRARSTGALLHVCCGENIETLSNSQVMQGEQRQQVKLNILVLSLGNKPWKFNATITIHHWCDHRTPAPELSLHYAAQPQISIPALNMHPPHHHATNNCLSAVKDEHDGWSTATSHGPVKPPLVQGWSLTSTATLLHPHLFPPSPPSLAAKPCCLRRPALEHSPCRGSMQPDAGDNQPVHAAAASPHTCCLPRAQHAAPNRQHANQGRWPCKQTHLSRPVAGFRPLPRWKTPCPLQCLGGRGSRCSRARLEVPTAPSRSAHACMSENSFYVTMHLHPSNAWWALLLWEWSATVSRKAIAANIRTWHAGSCELQTTVSW